MKNFIKPGCMMTVPAPADTLSGDLVVIGALFGIAATSALTGVDVEVKCGGVYDLAKAAGQSWTVGAAVYWDATAKVITTTAATNLKVGVVAGAAVSAAVVGRVRLNGAF